MTIENKNWEEAQKICEEEGAHLLILNSDEEAHAVGSMLQGFYYWIGFHDQYVEGQYVTVFSKYREFLT